MKDNGKYILIGGLEYKICFRSKKQDKRIKKYMGYADHQNRKIVIDSKVRGNDRNFILLHELIHCTNDVISGPFDLDVEDNVIVFSHILHGAIKNCADIGLIKY